MLALTSLVAMGNSCVCKAGANWQNCPRFVPLKSWGLIMKHKSGTNGRFSKSRSRISEILEPWAPEGMGEASGVIFILLLCVAFYGSFKMSFHIDFMSRPVYNGLECSLSALRGDLWEICEAKLNEGDFGWKRTKIPTCWSNICLDQADILDVRDICLRKVFFNHFTVGVRGWEAWDVVLWLPKT